MRERNFPDPDNIELEAASYVEHPQFDVAMRAFCGGLAEFHSVARTRRTGGVDTITWAVTMLVIYLDAYSPQHANAAQIVAICQEGRLSVATATRNAIALLRQAGMITADGAAGGGRAHRFSPTPALIETTQDNLAIRFAAMEPLIAWPKPAGEWARTDSVLLAFARGNVEALRYGGYKLYDNFPEVRNFMDRRCGYLVLLYSLARLEMSADGGTAVMCLSEVAADFAVSRAHIRKLFAEATARRWLSFEPGSGRLVVSAQALARYRLWFGHEFAWMRRLTAGCS